MIVHIVVNIDLGWDSVIGVFDTYEKALAACSPSQEDLDSEGCEFYLDMIDPDTGIYEMHHIHSKEVK